jgi:hypothetical protein
MIAFIVLIYRGIHLYDILECVLALHHMDYIKRLGSLTVAPSGSWILPHGLQVICMNGMKCIISTIPTNYKDRGRSVIGEALIFRYRS